MKWEKKQKQTSFLSLTERRSADGSCEAHGPKSADGLQTSSWYKIYKDKEALTIQKKNEDVRNFSSKGFTEWRIDIQKKYWHWGKKKDNNQFWDSDSSMVQIWLFALICTKTRFKVSSQSKTTSAENSDIHLALNHNRMLSNYYVSILQTDFVRGKVVAFFIFCFLCKKFKFDSLASDWSFAYCSYLPFKKKNVFF